GRVFGPSDDVRGCPATAVLSHAFWQRELGGDAGAVGRQITLSGHVFDIVGVAERGFTGLETGTAPSVFVPLCTGKVMDPSGGFLDHRSWWFLTILGRMRPDLPLAQVNARLALHSPGWFERTTPPNWSAENVKDYLGRRFVAHESVDALSGVRTTYASALLVLMGIVGLVLLVACANVANLMLARASVRRRELAVRVALGASRGRLVQQLFVEGLLLSLAGAAIGIALAYQGSHLLVRMMSSRDPVSLDLSIDARVLLFTIGVAVATAVLFGLAPAWRAARTDPQSSMQGHGGRGVIEGHSRFGIGKVLVSAQVALSLVLVTGASLLVGSFRALEQVEAGFTPDQVLVVQANLRESREAALTVQARVLERLRSLPGVRSAASSFTTPLGRSSWNDLVVIDGLAAARPEDREIYLNEVSSDYFATLGMRLVAGRDIGPQDRIGTPAVAVINRSAALRYFKHASPVGRIFRLERGRGTSPPIEVIGVVADAKYRNLRDPAPPSAFFALAQDSSFDGGPAFVIKATGRATGLQDAVTAVFAEVQPRATLRFKALEEQVADTIVRERLLATLSGFFGILAVLLAAIGLYGTMAYHVARRRGEIGIRLALGAAPRRVLGGVLGEVGVVLVIGTVLGLAGVLVAAPLVQQFLFGLTPRDPQAIAASAAILAAAAAIAGYLPARRAARLDP
ncbi:MAG: FtsX-like permease family protein, partial [Gemmatimonadetes bacterium]|nr:FtsX-like permease family protein [Gemmatimonadota bacterium]